MARAVDIHLVPRRHNDLRSAISPVDRANFRAIPFSCFVEDRLPCTIIDTNGRRTASRSRRHAVSAAGHVAFDSSSRLPTSTKPKSVTSLPTSNHKAPPHDEDITQSDEEASGWKSRKVNTMRLSKKALRMCVEMTPASTSVLQRRLRIGYGLLVST